MDITHGEFKDFYSPQASKSFGRSSSNLSSRGSVSCSIEYLSPEEIERTDEPADLLNKEAELASTNTHSVVITSQDGVNKLKSSISSQKSKSVQDILSDSSSTQSIVDAEKVGAIKDSVNADEIEEIEQDAELALAMKKMKNLDRILAEKMKREQEVKKQRLLNQKNFYSMLEKLELQKQGGGTYSDVASNTAKYLALLPPPQQLDVLLERQESADISQPFFQTQCVSSNSDHSISKKVSQATISSRNSKTPDKPRASSSTERRVNSEDAESLSKPSSAGSNSRRHKKNEKNTDFIERNIELAKDAGSYVAMTEEEKKRLGELLHGIDEEDSNFNEESDAFTQLVASNGEGYTPEPDEMKHLQEIDVKLQALLSQSGYNSISTTPRLNHNFTSTSTEMTEIGRKIAKSKLTESLPPSQRLEEIEEKLLKLDDQWKAKFDDSGPRLTDEQVQRLLDECCRCTSPNSITTSSFSKLDFRDNDELSNHSVFSSSFSETNSVLSYTPESGSRCSISSDVTLRSAATSLRSKPLDKDVLENLLLEARTSLGMTNPVSQTESPPQDSRSTSSEESDDSVAEDAVLNEV